MQALSHTCWQAIRVYWLSLLKCGQILPGSSCGGWKIGGRGGGGRAERRGVKCKWAVIQLVQILSLSDLPHLSWFYWFILSLYDIWNVFHGYNYDLYIRLTHKARHWLLFAFKSPRLLCRPHFWVGNDDLLTSLVINSEFKAVKSIDTGFEFSPGQWWGHQTFYMCHLFFRINKFGSFSGMPL